GIERLAALRRRCLRYGAIILPGLAIGLARHIRQRIQAVLWSQDDLIHGDVVRPLALGVKGPRRIEVSIRRRVQLGSVALQRMGAELFDIDRYRRGQTLGTEGIEPEWAAVRVRPQRQAICVPRLIAGDQRFAVLDSGCWP